MREAVGIDNSLRFGFGNLATLTGQNVGPSVTAGGITFDPTNRAQMGSVSSQDDLIKRAVPQGEQLLRGGTQDAIALTQQGLQEQLATLSGFQNPAAFQEQQALLGLSGQDAQAQAIQNIPLSAAQRELESMDAERLRRQAAAGGNLSSGSGLLSQQQLGAEQRAGRIANRLSELEGLAGIDRQISSDISRLIEASGARVGTLQQGLGSQLSSLYLGTAPAAAQSIQSRAELAGLKKIGNANYQASMIGNLANLAGMGANMYAGYQSSVAADPYGFGSSDPFSVSYGG